MNLKELFIRLKPRLSKDDLAYVADIAMDIVLSTEKGKQLGDILAIPFPDEWKPALRHHIQEVICEVANGANRKDQARLFRQKMLRTIESTEFNNFIFNDETRKKLWLTHYYADNPEWSEIHRESSFISEWAMDNLLSSSLQITYYSQYDKTLSLESFSELYKAQSLTNAELAFNGFCVKNDEIVSTLPLAKSYDKFVSAPLAPRIRDIKERCAQAIINGNLDAIQRVRKESIEFAQEYEAAIEKAKSNTSPGIIYKRAFNPDPQFFAALLAGVFFEPNLRINNEELERLVSKLPENLRARAKSWIVVYLAWALYLMTCDKYGEEFASQTLDELRQLNQKAESKIENLDDIVEFIDYWFPRFNLALDKTDAPEQVKEIPLQYLAALLFMREDPDGPLFALEGEDEIYFELYEALTCATEQTRPAYARAIEVGAPLEELK